MESSLCTVLDPQLSWSRPLYFNFSSLFLRNYLPMLMYELSLDADLKILRLSAWEAFNNFSVTSITYKLNPRRPCTWLAASAVHHVRELLMTSHKYKIRYFTPWVTVPETGCCNCTTWHRFPAGQSQVWEQVTPMCIMKQNLWKRVTSVRSAACVIHHNTEFLTSHKYNKVIRQPTIVQTNYFRIRLFIFR